MKVSRHLDQLGISGLLLTVVLSPCCFPLFASLASALGLGSFELFGGWTMWIFQAMVIITIGGLFPAYRRHRCMYPFMVAIPSGFLIFYGYYGMDNHDNANYLYTGMAGLLIATFWNYRRNKMHGDCKTCTTNNGQIAELQSTITCPECGHKKSEIMPTDACVFFYECENCRAILKPLSGDCCVFCSYGTVPCPPKQTGQNCC